ncbi:hypothetical protein FB45DRAFT_1068225 [Roridomyces roridus]|uniref:Protein-lysine N-methyltransferase EFM3 n=1 Tax=Roridomyces roridus TaxID=1738132 RepID=A0AAD7B138_9AGAR|nr:hypothetical protein FB45DRAFT_1068225 [Roridomyces roridus]
MTTMLPELFEILRGYAALVPPKHLQFPTHLEAHVINTFLADRILTNPHFERYPPSKQYQKSFWKWTIDHLEKMPADPEEFEVDSRIYDHYLELLNIDGPSLTGSNPPSQSYVTHFWKPPGAESYQSTTLLESRTMIEGGTTGLRTWLASLILAQYLITHASLVQGKRILELGSGIGFLGSVVASLQLLDGDSIPAGHGTLYLSDINDSVISRCRDNIQLPCNSSSTHPSVKFCFLDWSAALDPDGIVPLTSLLHEELDAELMLGADIVFDPDLIPALVAVLRLALQPRSDSHSRCALIALTVRNPSTMKTFVDTVQNNHLSLETLDLPTEETIFIEPLEGGDVNNGVNIFRITTQ